MILHLGKDRNCSPIRLLFLSLFEVIELYLTYFIRSNKWEIDQKKNNVSQNIVIKRK